MLNFVCQEYYFYLFMQRNSLEIAILFLCINPTNQENWPNVFPYVTLYWANVLAIVPCWANFPGLSGTI